MRTGYAAIVGLALLSPSITSDASAGEPPAVEMRDESTRLSSLADLLPDDATVADPALAELLADVAAGCATMQQMRAFHHAYFQRFPFDRPLLTDLRTSRLRQVEELEATASTSPARVGGTGWAPIGPVNFGGRATAVAPHPTSPNSAYVGSAGGGVWRWAPIGGDQYYWYPLFENQPTLAIGALAIDPVAPSKLYAGTGEMSAGYDAYEGMGVIRSLDGGATWLPPVSVNGASRIGDLVVRPDQPATVFAATSLGLYRSLDSGATWQEVLQMLPGTGQTWSVQLDPVDADRVFVGVGGGSGTAGVYLSTTGGGPGSFSMLSGLPVAAMERVELAIAPSDATVIYAALGYGSGEMWKSTDAGSSWFQVTTPSSGGCGAFCGNQCGYNLAVEVDPTDAAHVLAGGICLFRSTDGGVSWTPSPTSHPDHHDIAFLAGQSTILSANDGGVFRWNFNTGYGAPISDGFNTLQLNGVAHEPNNVGLAYVAAQDNYAHRLFIAGGESSLIFPPGCIDGGRVRVLPLNSRVFATVCPLAGSLNVSASEIQGTSFSLIVTGINPAEGSSWVPPLELAGATSLLTATRDRVYKTTNADAAQIPDITWAPLGTTDLTPAPGNGWIATVASTPLDANVFWAGTSSGLVWVTQDGGANWTERWSAAGGRQRAIGKVVASPVEMGRAWITLGGFGGDGYDTGNHIYTTSDYGQTWTPFTTTLPDIPVHTFALDNQDPNHFWAGTWLGVFKTEDAGASWSRHTAVPAIAITDLSLDPIENNLFAATYGRGVFRLVDVPQRPDLVLTKTRTSAPVAPQASTVTFQIGLSNVGTVGMTNATLGDSYVGCFQAIGAPGSPCPSGPVAPSITCAGPGCAGMTCTAQGNGFFMSNLNLSTPDGSPGGPDEVTVTVDLVAGTIAGNCLNAVVSTDPTHGSIYASDSVMIAAPAVADLILTKTRLSPAVAAPRSPVRFNIALRNDGEGALTNARLGDTLPSCFAPLGATGAPCPTGIAAPAVRCVGAACATATCTLASDGVGFLYTGINLAPDDGAPGGADEMTITLDVNAGPGTGICTNLAAINDPTDGVISATDSVTLVASPIADLDLRKTRTSSQTTMAGSAVSFDVALANVGLSAATGVSVGDTMPTCLQPLGVAGNPCPIGPCMPSVSCIGPGCAGTTCTISNGGHGFVLSNINLAAFDFAPGGGDELTILVNAVAGSTPGICTNLVGALDPTDGVITSTASVTIGSGPPSADLTLSSNVVGPPRVNPADPIQIDLHLGNIGNGALVNGTLGDTMPSCLQPLGVSGSPCPVGGSAPSVSCAGPGCGSATCTISNGGYGFLFSNIALAANDGCPGGGDQMTVTVRALASTILGACANTAAIQDPTDGLLTSFAGLQVVRPFSIYWSNSVTGDNAMWRFTPQLAFRDGTYLPSIADLSWQARGAGDLDHDDLNELLWRHATAGDNVTWTLDGSTLVASVYLPSVNNPAAVLSGAADMNRDRNDDLLWRNSATGDNAVWYMNGNIIIGSAMLPRLTDLNWQLVGGGDFSGDGLVDLLWWNAATGDIVLWLMNGSTLVSGVHLGTVVTSWRAVAVADADADGDADIIWREAASGANAIWVMNGTAYDHGVALPSATADWYIGGAR